MQFAQDLLRQFDYTTNCELRSKDDSENTRESLNFIDRDLGVFHFTSTQNLYAK